MDQIPHPVIPPINNDIMWITLFCVMSGYLIWRHRGRSELSNTALMFFGAWSMFWQEFFSNWGGYLLYSPDLNLLPWGSTWWTAPNKPVFLIFSYPVFFTFIYTVLIFLLRKAHKALPAVPLLAISLIIATPIFYGYNLLVDGASVDAGIWNYVDALGPVITTSGGGAEPLLWPALPFAFYGALMAYSLMRVDEKGHPTFLRLGKPDRYAPGIKRETVRALTSMLWWNAMYWFLLTMPVNLGRELFGHPSALVP